MTYNKETLKEAIVQKLRLNYGCTEQQATDGEMMKACAMVLRDIMAEHGVQTREETAHEEKRKVHYLSLEFLMGRSLMKNAFNLALLEPLTAAIGELGFKAADIFDMEPDAGLGNGGLGRLAACYLDSMTTLEIPATGYSICYELGIFKQKIVEGQQVELPDDWMQLGDAWLLPKLQEAEEVRFGGKVRTRWDNNHLMVVHEDYTRVLAIPCDMEIAGYDTDHVNTLRLWQARSPKPIDMKLFSEGQYLHAAEERAMADAISQVLYPEDNHYEGKSLRLKQQYFFVSATIQSITRKHIQQYGTLKNFHEKNVIQINDTHPTLVIPELMRILVDDAGMSWDEAWNITTHCVAYTNHTVLSEALEVWPQQLFETLLPRVWQILQEISRRWQQQVEDFFHDPAKTAKLAIIWDGGVRMANLCIAGSMAVNGVSALHSEILRKDLFKDACQMMPDKFKNVTNGIDHRRWVPQINPGLDGLLRDLIGEGYLTHPQELKKLEQYAGDKTVLARLEDIKKQILPSGVNDNLDVLMAGPIPPNPSELVSRQSLDIIIGQLKEHYDYVIIDTTPIGLVTDTQQIARIADLTVYMCRADYTPKSSIAFINSLNAENKMPNMCIVINGIDMAKKKYGYYYGYGKYGKYGKYGHYGKYGNYGKSYGSYGANYGSYGNYANSGYGNRNDNSIKV